MWMRWPLAGRGARGAVVDYVVDNGRYALYVCVNIT